MVAGEQAAFGALLRQQRRSAGLTQEALAERAGLSADAVAALERGRRTTPRLSTVTLLAEALALGDAARTALVAAALGEPSPTAATAPAQERRPAPCVPLPAPPNALIGRERELEAIRRLLTDGEAPVRLLTLLGPGGAGKTRLALAAGATLADAFTDGVAFVDLSTLQDTRLVADSIARALGLQPMGGQEARDLLLAGLRERRMLLVLDNLEQLLGAGRLLADLLAGCAGLALLATSRAPLRLRAESRFPMPPLAVPAPVGRGGPDHPEGEPSPATGATALLVYPAVQLFVERAQSVAPDLVLDDENAEAVAEICRRLDGLPLAIELAAARSGLLAPRALLARLGRRLPLLTGGSADLPERQQTLRAAIAWSYELLAEPAQALFARFGVFAGGCTLETSLDVCDPDGEAGALDALTALVDHSLVRRDDAEGETRLTMLETIHEYARERLERSSEAESVHRRHAEHYLALAEQAAARRGGAEQARWLARLEREHDNLRAALDWAMDGGDLALGLRTAAQLWFFWQVHGHLSEGRTRLEALLARAEQLDPAPPELLAPALFGVAVLARLQGDYVAAQAFGEQDLALRRELGDARGIAAALTSLGNIARLRGAYDEAAALYETSLPVYQALGDRWSEAVALNNLGNIDLARGDYACAVGRYRASLAILRELGNAWMTAGALVNLANAVRQQGDLSASAALGEESFELYRSLHDSGGVARALLLLGNVACDRGDYAFAAPLLRESLARHRRRTHAEGTIDALMGLGRLAGEQGDPAAARAAYGEALVLCRTTGYAAAAAGCLEALAACCAERSPEAATCRLAAADALRTATGAPRPPLPETHHDALVTTLRRMLGDDAFEAAWMAGQALDWQAEGGETTGC
jgi:predicted ATPase/DNA-binding XRE family transcriptional regulator